MMLKALTCVRVTLKSNQKEKDMHIAKKSN